MNSIPSIDTLITPELRNELLGNKDQFIAALNEALDPLGVKYTFGKSISFCVKQSPKYLALAKKDQTSFMNRVKSVLKVHKVGERLTLEAIVNGYWAQFNGSLVDKEGVIKKLNVSFIRGDIKASKEDDNVVAAIEQKRIEAETARVNKALDYFKSKYNVSEAELANAISVAGTVIE